VSAVHCEPPDPLPRCTRCLSSPHSLMVHTSCESYPQSGPCTSFAITSAAVHSRPPRAWHVDTASENVFSPLHGVELPHTHGEPSDQFHPSDSQLIAEPMQLPEPSQNRAADSASPMHVCS